MGMKWIRFELSPEIDLNEARKWCKENCEGRYKISNPEKGYGFTSSIIFSEAIQQRGPGAAKFNKEIDAMAFKLRWI